MKINRLLLLLLLALYAPWAVQAQTLTSNRDYVDLTFAEGPITSDLYVPFCDFSISYGTRSQFIIPATSLGEMIGGSVERLIFYSTTQSHNWGSAEFAVYVAEVENTVFATNEIVAWNTMTEVYNGSLCIAGGRMVIELQNPFWYNGGNLLIGFQETVTGTNAASTPWYCVTYPNYPTVYGFKVTTSSVYLSNRSHNIPKVTFSYLPSPYTAVVSITQDDISGTTAAFSWSAPSNDVTGYAYQYKLASSEEWPTSWSSTTDTSATIDNLLPLTEYMFRVKALYGEHESFPTKTNFMTDCPEYTSVPFFENFDGFLVGSNFPSEHLLPMCWDYINTTTTGSQKPYPSIYGKASDAYSVPNCLFFYVFKNANPKPQYAILPPMQNINELCIKLKAKQYNTPGFGYSSTFKVGVIDLDDNTFTTIATLTPTSMYQYQSYSIDLDSYEGSGDRIAIMVDIPESGSYYGSVLIDDIIVEEIPKFTKEIASYEQTSGGWYLISSPLANPINAENVEHLINTDNPVSDFDLYRFNSSATVNPTTQQVKNWENWKQPGDHYHFNLEPGRGYLYANTNAVNLTFRGTPYSGNGEVSLYYNGDSPWKGWNLVGNPFPDPAYIGDRAFYRMNDDGSGMVASNGTAIEAMEGVFVYTENNGEILTFITTPPENRNEQLSINVNKVMRSGLTTTIDRAILRFDEGNMLPKFQLNQESTKVYIPQNGLDYAVVNVQGQGEMPINFRAEENGTYTLSFSCDNVEFGYLHLFDNKTGTDINLLNTSSYTFNATTTDYESRFKLVFATGSSVSGDNFSFINSNGNFSIFGIEGEATLQVFDVMGRMLSSETFSGSIEKQLHVAPGVYFIHLVNGQDVKTQKIVVR